MLVDFQDFEVCDLTPEVMRLAIDFIEQFFLRTLDAIQLASAAASQADVFVSSDTEQLKAAQKARLKIFQI